MYSVLDRKKFEILSYRLAFLESTEISASEELNVLEKAPAQFYGIADIKWEGTSSVYAIAEIKREMPFSPVVLHE